MTTRWYVAAVEARSETWVLLETTLFILVVEVKRTILGDHTLIDVVISPIAD